MNKARRKEKKKKSRIRGARRPNVVDLSKKNLIIKSFTGSRGGFLKEPLAAGGIKSTVLARRPAPTKSCRGDSLWSPVPTKYDFDAALPPCFPPRLLERGQGVR
jgi:hypothetical protein